jgi:hypothetical protein
VKLIASMIESREDGQPTIRNGTQLDALLAATSDESKFIRLTAADALQFCEPTSDRFPSALESCFLLARTDAWACARIAGMNSVSALIRGKSSEGLWQEWRPRIGALALNPSSEDSKANDALRLADELGASHDFELDVRCSAMFLIAHFDGFGSVRDLVGSLDVRGKCAAIRAIAGSLMLEAMKEELSSSSDEIVATLGLLAASIHWTEWPSYRERTDASASDAETPTPRNTTIEYVLRSSCAIGQSKAVTEEIRSRASELLTDAAKSLDSPLNEVASALAEKLASKK